MTQRVAQLRQALDANATTIDDIPKFDVAPRTRSMRRCCSLWKARGAERRACSSCRISRWGSFPSRCCPLQRRPPLRRSAAVRKLPAGRVARAPRGDHATAFGQYAHHLAPHAGGRGEPPRLCGLRRSVLQQKAGNREVVAFADDTVGTRGVRLRSTPKVAGLSSAQLALLPRLPDTRAEILDVAQVMRADLNQDVFPRRARERERRSRAHRSATAK